MTDIDPKSIPVLDDVIEDDSNDLHADDQHVPVTDEVSAVEADELFSPASLLDEEPSRPADNIDHAANIAALEGGTKTGIEAGVEDSRLAAGQPQEVSAAGDTGEDIHSASDTTDHIDAITALDQSTTIDEDYLIDDYPDPGNEPGKDINDAIDDVINEAADGFVDQVSAETEQTGTPQQPEISTAAVTNQIIDRIMPEIEQRLRVIIDLTLREHLRDRSSEE